MCLVTHCPEPAAGAGIAQTADSGAGMLSRVGDVLSVRVTKESPPPESCSSDGLLGYLRWTGSA